MYICVTEIHMYDRKPYKSSEMHAPYVKMTYMSYAGPRIRFATPEPPPAA